MTLLQQYEHQYAGLIAETTAQIGRLQLQYGAERRQLVASIDDNISEAQELLEQISLEIRELPATQREAATSKLGCAQVELKRLSNEYQKAKEIRLPAKGSETIDIGGGDSDYYEDVSINVDQRQRLLENSERIERTGSRLTEGYRVALETEAVGAQVLTDLHHQRETLQGARARLRETNADLGRASRTLNSMMMRAMREKAVLYGVGLVFVIAVVVSLYMSFFSSAPSTS